MGIGSRALTAGGLAFAAAFVVGCGTSQIKGGLSESANNAISGNLSAVGDAVSDGSCARAHSALTMLDTTLAELPSDTNAQLRKNLTQGAATVRELAVEECRGAPVPTSSSSTTNSSSSSPTTSSTPTTPTTISTPTTTTTTTTTMTQSQSQSQSDTTPGTGSVTALGSTTSNTSSNGGAGLSGAQ